MLESFLIAATSLTHHCYTIGIFASADEKDVRNKAAIRYGNRNEDTDVVNYLDETTTSTLATAVQGKVYIYEQICSAT